GRHGGVPGSAHGTDRSGHRAARHASVSLKHSTGGLPQTLAVHGWNGSAHGTKRSPRGDDVCPFTTRRSDMSRLLKRYLPRRAVGALKRWRSAYRVHQSRTLRPSDYWTGQDRKSVV